MEISVNFNQFFSITIVHLFAEFFFHKQNYYPYDIANPDSLIFSDIQPVIAQYLQNRIYKLRPRPKLLNKVIRKEFFDRSTQATIYRHSIHLDIIYTAYLELPVPRVYTPQQLQSSSNFLFSNILVKIIFNPSQSMSKDNSYCYNCRHYTLLNLSHPFDPTHKPNWFYAWYWNLPKELQNPNFQEDDYDYDPWAPSLSDFTNSADESRYDLSFDDDDYSQIHYKVPPPPKHNLPDSPNKRTLDRAQQDDHSSEIDDDDAIVPPTQKKARILVPSSQASPTF